MKFHKGAKILKTILIVFCSAFLLCGGFVVYEYLWGTMNSRGMIVESDLYEITTSGDIHLSGPVDAHQAASSITRRIIDGAMIEIDWNQLESNYGIKSNECESCSVFLAQKDTSAFEIAVFQVSTPEQKEKVLQAIQRRKIQKLASFKELNQAEYSLVQQAVIGQQDDFLLFAICKTPQKALDIFREVVKGS